ncbi:MAG: phytanoyl-CoA dioxygenase family protein [Rubrivivax sp.]|nr:phytanoyl-CoA dioxygenase family protein [Rubrivivax sp.]
MPAVSAASASSPAVAGALSPAQLALFRDRGHLTVPGLLTPAECAQLVANIHAWGERFLADLPPAQRAWYVDGGVKARDVLRKLDNPHRHVPSVQALAAHPALVRWVESIIGGGLSVYFSQVFFKPPEGGGPKPAHQDNFYFGPNDREGLVTAWVALDDATVDNGCLFFGEGTNRGPVHAHVAPADEPFNLQLAADVLAAQPMTPAPVPRGGVSFHHGNTFHQSGPNHSAHWRRAIALHYVNAGTRFVQPALPYDETLRLRVS